LFKEESEVRTKKQSRLFSVTLYYKNGMTRRVQVKASKLEIAEDRALKRNPSAEGIKRGG
jgi:hypothetical protein